MRDPRFVLRRTIARWRCRLGIHGPLTAHKHRESLSQTDAYPTPPRGLPGPGDTRRCENCGARWVGAYDGIEPFWRRVR